MKKWNVPAVVELEIAETANGLWNSDKETNVPGGGWNPAYVFTENNKKSEDEVTPPEEEYSR